ncbi:hypothetical protein F4775DRAFT_536596 [Biscogniauxia sp. FL1348]|nr:hypothetical protein F4775DRAFT_536596 [Biscogniauxia sp. FL1348]
MQSLVSRVAHAHSSCHCRLCLHTTTTTIVRRTTTATSRRRRPSFADVFTACYTTILGTAAVIDSQAKETRSRNIDWKIEQAKAWLAAREGLGKDAAADAQEPARSEGRYRLDSWRRAEKDALLAELSHLCGITLRPPNRPSWLQDQLSWIRIEANIAVEELDPEYILREPKNDGQLQRTANTIVRLVDQLLSQCQIIQGFRTQDAFEGDDEGRHRAEGAIGEVEKLYQSRHWPCYEHPLERPEDAAKIRSLLSDSIRRNFNKAASTKEIVANICYNLLTSSIPPSIHTYNTLISGFDRIQRPELAQAVIDSYIHDTTWPATQMTMVCLLNHYRCTDEINGLRDIVQRMRGVRDDGLHFRILPRVPWLKWDLKEYALRKYSFVLRARRTDDVYDSIITGWLQCGEVGNAAMTFVACLRNGCNVHHQTLQKLLKACLYTVDYAIARKLVRGMGKNFGKFAIMIHQIVRDTSTATARLILNRLWHILEICWMPYDFIDAPITRIFAQATHQLKALIVTTQVQLEVRETAELCIYSLNKLLNSPLEDRLDRVIQVLNAAQDPRKRNSYAMAGFGRLARLVAIQTRHLELGVRVAPITVQAKAAILKEKTGYDIDPSNLLESACPKSRVQKDRYLALCNSLETIEILPGPMTQKDIRFQLLRQLPNAEVARKLENSGRANNLAIRALVSFYRPGYFDVPKSEISGYSETVLQLEQDIINTIYTIRALLFAPLSGETQKKLMFRSRHWHSMPIEELVKYHLRRGPRLIGSTPDPDEGEDESSADSSRELSQELEESPLNNDVAPADATGSLAIAQAAELRIATLITLASPIEPPSSSSDKGISLPSAEPG